MACETCPEGASVGTPRRSGSARAKKADDWVGGRMVDTMTTQKGPAQEEEEQEKTHNNHNHTHTFSRSKRMARGAASQKEACSKRTSEAKPKAT